MPALLSEEDAFQAHNVQKQHRLRSYNGRQMQHVALLISEYHTINIVALSSKSPGINLSLRDTFVRIDTSKTCNDTHVHLRELSLKFRVTHS